MTPKIIPITIRLLFSGLFAALTLFALATPTHAQQVYVNRCVDGQTFQSFHNNFSLAEASGDLIIRRDNEIVCQYLQNDPENSINDECNIIVFSYYQTRVVNIIEKRGNSDISCHPTGPKIILPNSTNINFTVIGYDNNNHYYTKIWAGTQNNGREITNRIQLDQGSSDVGFFDHSFPPVRGLPEGHFFAGNQRFVIKIGENRDLSTDQYRVNLTFYVNNQPESDTPPISNLCCENGSYYDTDMSPENGTFGKCLSTSSLTGVPTTKAPNYCYLDEEDNTWKMGHGGYLKLCDQVGASVLKSRCLECVNEQNGTWTAIGCIPGEPEDIISSVVRLGVSVAGGIALLLILYGSFTLSISAGDPQKAGQGKEIITAAISGLIFILLAISLLQFIGVEIIRIPGLQ